MKPETRILVSYCTDSLCGGLVVRGQGFDGVAFARDCPGLCKRLEKQGYIGELRYHYGPCSCGLESLSGDYRLLGLQLFLKKTLQELESLLESWRLDP